MSEITLQLDRARELRREGHIEEALALFEESLRRWPDSPRGNAGYAYTLEMAGRIEEAIVGYREAVRLRDKYPTAWLGLGNAYLSAGDVPRGVEALERAVVLGEADTASPLLFTLNYHHGRPPEAIYAAHVVWGRRAAGGHRVAPHTNDRTPSRILKVGYVSGTLRCQTTYSFFSPLAAGHDSSVVDVTCYDNTPEPDDCNTDLRRFAAWRRIHGVSDQEAAAQIRADGIDILVDLSGHVAGNRMGLFALKPAPVQATYLGYPNTTGLPTVDYRFTDAIADPPGRTDALHTEALVRLPRCFLAYRPFASVGEVAEAPALRTGAVTFGSFSSPLKWNDCVIDAWAAVLARVPNSRIILHHGGGSKDKTVNVYDALEKRVLTRFVASGVQSERIRLVGYLNLKEHHELYGEVDLLLDPFPYNGTTAVCEGLWMGVPSIALTGETHVARVATSILHTVGLERLAAATFGDYVETAVASARDVPALAALRAGLRQRVLHSPVMDGAGLASAMEEAYRQMWRRWCESAGRS